MTTDETVESTDAIGETTEEISPGAEAEEVSPRAHIMPENIF